VTQPTAPDASEGRSLGDIVGEIARDLGSLVRQEMDLAKVEIKNEISKAGKGAGMLGGAGVAGHLALLFLSVTVMFALGQVMDLVWAALIVTVIWAVAAAVLAASGRKHLQQVDPKLQATTQTLKEDAQWARTATRRD
jgi:uncharacterized membrane protein YqjE